MHLHFMKESSLKSIPEVSVIEMLYMTPETIIRITTFRNKAMNMWIPFEGASKRVENTDKPRSKVLCLFNL